MTTTAVLFWNFVAFAQIPIPSHSHVTFPIPFPLPNTPCLVTFPRDSHGKIPIPNSHYRCRPLLQAFDGTPHFVQKLQAPVVAATYSDVKSVGEDLRQFDGRRAETVGQLAMVVARHADVALLVPNHVRLQYLLHPQALVVRVADDFDPGRVQHHPTPLG